MKNQDTLQELIKQLDENKIAFEKLGAGEDDKKDILLNNIRQLEVKIKDIQAQLADKKRLYKTELEFREFSQIVKVPQVHTLLDMCIEVEGIEQRAISLYAEADFNSEIVEIEFIGVPTSANIPKAPFKYFKTLTSENKTLHFYYK